MLIGQRGARGDRGLAVAGRGGVASAREGARGSARERAAGERGGVGPRHAAREAPQFRRSCSPGPSTAPRCPVRAPSGFPGRGARDGTREGGRGRRTPSERRVPRRPRRRLARCSGPGRPHYAGGLPAAAMASRAAVRAGRRPHRRGARAASPASRPRARPRHCSSSFPMPLLLLLLLLDDAGAQQGERARGAGRGRDARGGMRGLERRGWALLVGPQVGAALLFGKALHFPEKREGRPCNESLLFGY